MPEKSDAQSAAELQADRIQIKEPVHDFDERQQVNISSDKPMRCFVKPCAVPITNSEPFIIVSSAGGCIFAHMRCLGMNLSGNYADPAYLRHIKQKLQAGLRDS